MNFPLSSNSYISACPRAIPSIGTSQGQDTRAGGRRFDRIWFQADHKFSTTSHAQEEESAQEYEIREPGDFKDVSQSQLRFIKDLLQRYADGFR